MMTNQGKVAMVVILFRVRAKPGQRQELVNFLEWNQKTSMERERGTLHFDVFQDIDSVDGFYVYEAYEDLAAFEEHKCNEPYKRWSSVEFQSAVVLSHSELYPVTP